MNKKQEEALLKRVEQNPGLLRKIVETARRGPNQPIEDVAEVLDQIYGEGFSAREAQKAGIPADLAQAIISGKPQVRGCGGASLEELIEHCREIRSIIGHLQEKHPEVLVEEQVENLIFDIMGIDTARFTATLPDECACASLKFGPKECYCPNQAELDIYKTGRIVRAVKVHAARTGLELEESKRALAFYF